ncbi:PAS domain-containing sensor histidine kinase [Pseudoduganella sp. UC29_71]|uniref:PAS domain-containing sensor histidine kinase n=1 Tax=Pseudoduganella sp. UC29_71 TaxID=3350174 RepID=UPI00366CCBB6
MHAPAPRAAGLHARGEISIALLVSVAVTAVVTLVLAAFAAYFYQSEKAQRWAQLRSDLAASADELAAAAALPVWNYDEAQIITIMKSGLSNRGLHASTVAPVGVRPYILVRGEDGRLHRAGAAPQDAQLLQERRAMRAAGQEIGAITLYASPAALLDELRRRSYAIAGMILVLDLALVAGLYFVLWHMMLKPVQAIGRFAADVQAGLNPAAPAPRAWLFGELKTLQASLREMIALLESRYQAMHASEQRLQIATRAAGIGIWDWDIASGTVRWDEQMYRLFGVPRAAVADRLQLWRDALHPEDKARTEAALQRTLDGNGQFDRAFRIVWADGSVRHLQADSMLFRDGAGRPVRMVGVNYDISAHKAAQQELRQHRHHLEELVAERTCALQVAVAQAQAASQAKSVFLANMSHELRTPLNAVIGFSRLMADSPGMQAEDKRNLGIIHRSGQHLLTLINDILELSKIEAGRVALQSEPVLLAEMLQEVMDMVSMRAVPGVSLRLDTRQLPLRAQLDGTKLRQVLLNLMSNAVKFTRAGRVTLQAQAGWEEGAAGGAGRWQLAFAVCDTGPGIAAADQERIFEPFVQAGQDGVAEGTGLGLAISREFVQMMGGALTVQSAPGAGAEFRFAVPAGVAAGINPGAGPAGEAAPAPGGELPCAAGGTPPPLTAEALAALPPGSAAGLRAAVQELNLARAARLLAALPPACAGTAAAIERMLSLYQYPQLCAMLAPAQEHQHQGG